MHNWGSYTQKTAIGQSSPKYSGAVAQKLWVRSEKVRGLQKWDGRPLWDRWTHGDRRWQTMVFFVCMFVCFFVTLDVQDGGLDFQQRIMSPFVDQFKYGFHCFLQKETGFPTVCRDFNYITRWRHNYRRNRRKFWEIFKNWWKRLWERLRLFKGSI